MRRINRGLCIGMMMLTMGGAGLAQSGGGAVGGALGGVGGAVGGTVGGVGGAVGGTLGGVGGTMGGAGGLGGFGGPIGGIGSTVGGLGSGTQMIGGRLVNGTSEAIQLTRRDIERELESNLNSLGYGLWVRTVPRDLARPSQAAARATGQGERRTGWKWTAPATRQSAAG